MSKVVADLRCTDCLSKVRGLQSIPNHSIDLIFADLPYGVTNAKWDSIIPLKPLFKQYKRIIKSHGVILLFGVGLFASKLNVVGNEYVPYRYSWIWRKNRGTNQINCHRMPMSNYEEISVFYKHLPTYNPQMRIGKVHNIHHSRKSLKGSIFASGDLHHLGTVYTDKYYPLNVITFSNVNKKHKYHPTQKPIALLEYMSKTYTNKGNTVLDNTMGSGSTGVACALTGRNFIGMEISKKYYKISKARISKTGAKIKTARSHSYYYDQTPKHKAKVHADYVKKMQFNPRSKYYIGYQNNHKAA